MFQGGKNSRSGGWYFLEQDARLPGLSPGTERTRAGGGPRAKRGGRRLRVPTWSPGAGVRIAPVPGSCRRRPPSANDSSSSAKPVK